MSISIPELLQLLLLVALVAFHVGREHRHRKSKRD